jgi:hypothetical protein
MFPRHCPLSPQPEEVELKFQFTINGTTHPDAVLGAGQAVEDISYVSAGLFDILLKKECAFEDFISLVGDCNDATIGGPKFVLWTFSTRTLRVTTVLQDGSNAAADPADNSLCFVHAVFCRRSGMAPSVAI